MGLSRRLVFSEGFTLLELMVVLLIIGITLTFITFTVTTRQDEVVLEAQRLASLLNLAKDEAVLNSGEYAMEFGRDEYGFVRYAEDKWIPLDDDEVLRSRKLPEGMILEVTLEGNPVEPVAEGDEGEEGEEPPRIFLLSSGEYTPFSITVADQYSEISHTIVGLPPGRIRMAGELSDEEAEE